MMILSALRMSYVLRFVALLNFKFFTFLPDLQHEAED